MEFHTGSSHLKYKNQILINSALVAKLMTEPITTQLIPGSISPLLKEGKWSLNFNYKRILQNID